jgi:hypothetical protein
LDNSPVPADPPGRTSARHCEFARDVDEDDIRAQLDLALEGKGAFRRFREVVFRYPDLKKAWLEKRQQAFLE